MVNIQYYAREWWAVKRKQKIISVVIIIPLLFFIGKSLLWISSHPTDNQNKWVDIETLKTQRFLVTVHLIGTIHPKHMTVLMAKSTGTLESLIPSGQKIKKGTLIAQIDNADIEKNAQLSITAESIAKAQLERLNAPLAKGYVSTKYFEERKQAWINAQKEGSKTNIELNNLRFFAPFSGIVGAYKKREGAQIKPGDPVVSVYDPSSIVVDVDIPCSNLTTIQEGQSVYVFGKPYVLNHLQKMLDEESHMCPADIDITCKNCLMGSTVGIDLVLEDKKNAMAIPFQAVMYQGNDASVYIVEKGVVRSVAIKTGLQQEDRIEIMDGLKPGQRLITKGQERLHPGMRVEVHEEIPPVGRSTP